MSDDKKIRSLMLRDPTQSQPPFERLEAILKKTTEHSATDIKTTNKSDDLIDATAYETPVYVFADFDYLIENNVPFFEIPNSKLILVSSGEKKNLSADESPWATQGSRLSLNSFSVSDLVRILQLYFQIDKNSGLEFFCEKGSDVFYDKIQSSANLGTKIDKCISHLEKNKPEFSSQLFNLRQLLFSVLSQSMNISGRSSKLIPTIDFQITSTKERIAFSTSFNAPKNFHNQIISDIYSGKNQVWLNAYLSSDILFLTEVKKTRQIEIKALIQKDGEFHNGKSRSIIIESIESFQNTDISASKQIRLTPLETISVEPEVEGGQTDPSQENSNQDGTQLNYKLKAGLLENEKSALKGLVKKKNQLITEMNKDINRAQKEVMATKNTSLKELRAMRLEMEKAQRECFEAKEKLKYYQRKEEEKSAEGENAGNAENEIDFEKELKQTELARRQWEEKYESIHSKFKHQEENFLKSRKDLEEAKAEIHNLKNKVVQLSRAQQSESIAKEKESSVKDGNISESQMEKFKEIQKNLGDSMKREQEADKEVKRLTLKLENAEQGLKSQTSTLEKKLESTERQLEETKKKLGEFVKKIDGQRGESKKSEDELKTKEREQKIKIDNLTVKLSDAEKQLAHSKKKTEEQQKKIVELQAALNAELANKKAA